MNNRIKSELTIWDKDYLQSRFDSQVDVEDYDIVNLVFSFFFTVGNWSVSVCGFYIAVVFSLM